MGWTDSERDLTRERAVLAAMTATMACRGPDGEGLYVTPRAGLGHRRLAVIDPPGGAQPFVDGDVALVFGGEVYNFVELRRELVVRGHAFRTSSDTEVVLRAYLEWGAEAVRRLDGMFAFAVWDGRVNRLLLARDRFGIKPLYYVETAGGIVFGSEPKAILANPLYSPEAGADELRELFGMFPFVSPGTSLYKGMKELPPAHVLMSDGAVRVERYWSLEHREHTDDDGVTARTVRTLVEEEVARQLVADVPLGALLSGGLDSSTLVALAAPRAPGGKLATFSVDFAGSAEHFTALSHTPSRDRPYSARMAEHLGTFHTDIVIDAGSLSDLEETVVRARDLPALGDLDLSLLLLCRNLRDHVTVAISGESADEIFGGYTWFGNTGAGTFPWLDPQLGFPWLHPQLVRMLSLPEYVADRHAAAVAEVPVVAGESAEDRRMRELYHLALTRHLPAMLARKDRMSMAAGLEVRVPYCSREVVEYVWNVPWRMKAAGGREKGLLRAAAAGLLPDDVRLRRKSRYPSPQTPAYLDGVWQRARDVLDDPGSPLRPLLHGPNMRRMLAADVPDDRRAELTPMLASFLSIDTWLRLYHVRIR